MEPDNAARVHYDRWNEENINMNVEATQTTNQRFACNFSAILEKT